MAHVGTLLDVSFIRYAVSLLSQLKHILGLADQRAHALTLVFGCEVKPGEEAKYNAYVCDVFLGCT